MEMTRVSTSEEGFAFAMCGEDARAVRRWQGPLRTRRLTVLGKQRLIIGLTGSHSAALGCAAGGGFTSVFNSRGTHRQSGSV